MDNIRLARSFIRLDSAWYFYLIINSLSRMLIKIDLDYERAIIITVQNSYCKELIEKIRICMLNILAVLG